MIEYIGFLPYVYLDEPLNIGTIKYEPLLINEKNTSRSAYNDRHLKNIASLFRDGLGNNLVAATYFIVDTPQGSSIDSILNDIQTSIHILRFSLFNSYNQNLSFEQTFLYLFEIPPIYEHVSDSGDSYAYRCLVNLQTDAYFHSNMTIFPSLPDIRTSIIYRSDFDNLQVLQKSFFGHHLCISDNEHERILIAVDWYNQSFQKSPVVDQRGKIVEISIAFEVLLDLPPQSITATFRSCVQILLGSSKELDTWANRFYSARSAIVHDGKTRTYLYKHPEAATEHLHLLPAARKVFVWCLNTMLGESRGKYRDEITRLFTSNEVYMNHLKKAQDYETLKEKGLLEEVSLLRPSYPVGSKKDIVKLGKLLLQSYRDLYMQTDHIPLPTLDSIIAFRDNDLTKLASLYFDFKKEFEPVYLRYISISEVTSDSEQLTQQKPEPISDIDRSRLENALMSFSEFAGFALLLPK